MTSSSISLAVWLAALAVFAVLPGVAEPARRAQVGGAAYELRAKSGALGRVPLIPAGGRQDYVSADQLAAVLNGAWLVRGTRGSLAVGSRAAHFTRDHAGVVLSGRTVALESPPLVRSSGWLLPGDFLAKALARLVPGVTAARVEPAARQVAAPPPVPKPAPTPDPPVALVELRYRSYPTYTRVVIEAAGPLRYELDSVPGQVRVRLANLSLSAARTEEVGDGMLEEILLEPARPGALLRVPVAGEPGDVQALALDDPHRLVIDIYRPRAAGEELAPDPGGPGFRLIVIDPGHGGHDPGAMGPRGLAEKDVVLDVSRRLARMIEEGLGIKVAMTRSTDVFVPLRERTNFANKQRADLFVSIHANAHQRSLSQGVETYFLSSEATDNDARQVAAIENGVVQLEGPGQRPNADLLKTILWDLAQSEFQQESSFLAETVQDLMTRSLQLVNRGVKQAGFYVLGGAAMPAVLVEVGFLTNPREERKLANPAHRESVARAIYSGLAEYKRRHDQRMRTVQGRTRQAP